MATLAAVLICLAWVGQGSRAPIATDRRHGHVHQEPQPLQRVSEKTLAMQLVGFFWQAETLELPGKSAGMAGTI